MRGIADQHDVGTSKVGLRSHPASLRRGTGTGKPHLAVAIVHCSIGAGPRARFTTVVELFNRLEAEARAGQRGRIADHVTRLDLVLLGA